MKDPWWRQLHAKLPKTHWGFPVDPPASVDAAHETTPIKPAEGNGDGGDKPGQRGIALIIAIMIISVMMLFTSDLILSSQVNITLATHVKDNIKAEYAAKSGMNIATLLVSSDFAYQLFQAQQNPQATTMTSGLGDMWTVLNGMPIGGDTAELFQKSSA